MTQISSKSGTQFAAIDDADSGEGLAIFFSQDGDAIGRYRVLVKALIDQGIYDMGEFFISPPDIASTLPVPTAAPFGRLSRMVAAAVCPGAIGWSVEVTPYFQVGTVNEPEAPEELADIVLASSKCCTAPVGVNRVGERYVYIAGTAVGPPTQYAVLPGQTVTGIACIGSAGGGSFTIDGGSTMLVAAGISVNFEPKAPIPPNAIIEFTDVTFAIEFLESA